MFCVCDCRVGDYGSAIETLVTAVSLIKQSKIANDDRCRILISSLQDTLHGIELKSYGSKYGCVSLELAQGSRWSGKSRNFARSQGKYWTHLTLMWRAIFSVKSLLLRENVYVKMLQQYSTLMWRAKISLYCCNIWWDTFFLVVIDSRQKTYTVEILQQCSDMFALCVCTFGMSTVPVHVLSVCSNRDCSCTVV